MILSYFCVVVSQTILFYCCWCFIYPENLIIFPLGTAVILPVIRTELDGHVLPSDLNVCTRKDIGAKILENTLDAKTIEHARSKYTVSPIAWRKNRILPEFSFKNILSSVRRIQILKCSSFVRWRSWLVSRTQCMPRRTWTWINMTSCWTCWSWIRLRTHCRTSPWNWPRLVS